MISNTSKLDPMKKWIVAALLLSQSIAYAQLPKTEVPQVQGHFHRQHKRQGKCGHGPQLSPEQKAQLRAEHQAFMAKLSADDQRFVAEQKVKYKNLQQERQRLRRKTAEWKDNNPKQTQLPADLSNAYEAWHQQKMAFMADMQAFEQRNGGLVAETKDKIRAIMGKPAPEQQGQHKGGKHRHKGFLRFLFMDSQEQAQMGAPQIQSFKLYPNPVLGQQLHLSFDLAKPVNKASLWIVNEQGMTVQEQNLGALSQGAQTVSVQLNDLPSGKYYWCKITENGQTLGAQRFLKQ
jgi:hypothetical protein